MRVQVLRTEPGFYTYVVNKPAELDLEIEVVAPDAPDEVLVKFTVMKATGVSIVSMQDTGERIGESYAKAGKELGQYLMKKGSL
jgi:hypothetical protein